MTLLVHATVLILATEPANAARIHGQLFDLDRNSLNRRPVRISVVRSIELNPQRLLPANGDALDITDNLRSPPSPVRVISRDDGRFDIDIPDVTDPSASQLVNILFERDRQVTETLPRLIIRNGETYHVDVTVPQPLPAVCPPTYPGYHIHYVPHSHASATRHGWLPWFGH
jgi:hypothetical protein